MPIVEDVAANAAPGLLGKAFGWLRRFTPSQVRLRLENGSPFELTHPANATSLVHRTWRIEVRNAGQSQLECLVKLEAMVRSDGKPFQNAFLPIGLTTQHQRGQGRLGGPFKLRAGEPKLVELASLDETKPESEIVLHYETDRYPNTVPRGSYRMTIGVFGGHKPRRLSCCLYIDGQGRLRLRREA